MRSSIEWSLIFLVKTWLRDFYSICITPAWPRGTRFFYLHSQQFFHCHLRDKKRKMKRELQLWEIEKCSRVNGRRKWVICMRIECFSDYMSRRGKKCWMEIIWLLHFDARNGEMCHPAVTPSSCDKINFFNYSLLLPELPSRH